MTEVRFGIVGTGGIGGLHKTALGELPEVRLTAVTDVVRASAEAFAADTDARVFTDHRALIASGEVDAILVATPHDSRSSSERRVG